MVGAGRPPGRAAGNRRLPGRPGSSVVDRLGYRGIAVLAPVARTVAGTRRRDRAGRAAPALYRWAALGCATWAVLGTVGTDLLIQLVRQP